MNAMLGIFNLGGGEVVLILVVVLIFFGAKKVPELAKGLGQGIKEFKKATREVTDEVHNAMDDNTPPQRPLSPIKQVQPTEPQNTVAQVTPAVKRID
jgi:sec-independent protein translocase protein TatA